MPNVGNKIKAENARWEFCGDTVKTFDEHIMGSIPFYNEGHDIVCEISDYFIKSDSVVYEIGTSTGEMILKLAKHNEKKQKVKFVGIDIEKDMICEAKEKQKKLGIHNVSFIVCDGAEAEFEPSDLIVSYYTMQFIRPSQRQEIFNKIYNSLKWGGAFIMFEKVRAPDARFQDMMSGIYREYKLRQGYSASEIMSKTQSLKGVLEPFSTQGNVDLLKRSGFVDIMTIFKYVCFEGFLAIK